MGLSNFEFVCTLNPVFTKAHRLGVGLRFRPGSDDFCYFVLCRVAFSTTAYQFFVPGSVKWPVERTSFSYQAV